LSKGKVQQNIELEAIATKTSRTGRDTRGPASADLATEDRIEGKITSGHFPDVHGAADQAIKINTPGARMRGALRQTA